MGLRIDLDEFEAGGDAVQPGLDGRVGDAEHLLHLLDRAVAAHKGGHEHLILGGELGEPRQLEGALDGHALFDQAHALDDDGPATGQLTQRLPVLEAAWVFVSLMTLILRFLILKSSFLILHRAPRGKSVLPIESGRRLCDTGCHNWECEMAWKLVMAVTAAAVLTMGADPAPPSAMPPPPAIKPYLGAAGLPDTLKILPPAPQKGDIRYET